MDVIKPDSIEDRAKAHAELWLEQSLGLPEREREVDALLARAVGGDELTDYEWDRLDGAGYEQDLARRFRMLREGDTSVFPEEKLARFAGFEGERRGEEYQSGRSN